MDQLRKILFPFSVLYGCITDIRNGLYHTKILQRTRFSKPLLVVGNLSVGGTGKTPMVEYLVRLVSKHYVTATLSRGYKRKSKGFILATPQSTMEEIGDEPYQYHHKFDQVAVAVDADRVQGVRSILELRPDVEVIILDDAFQHLPIQADLNILLTTYGEPYCEDLMLPAGNLRETRKGARRAQIIVVTKCPPRLTMTEQHQFRQKLKIQSYQHLFFTSIAYSDTLYNTTTTLPVSSLNFDEVLLVAGIAKPTSFFDHLKTNQTKCLSFPDHHHFSAADIALLLKTAAGNKIVTTEKDFVRLEHLLPAEQLYYLPIQTSFIQDGAKFDQIILDYVGTNSRNS